MSLNIKCLALSLIVVTGLVFIWWQHSLNTALLQALRSGHMQRAQALLQTGANANAEDQYGSALQEACRRGFVSMVDDLQRHGASLSPESAAVILFRMADVDDSQVIADRKGYHQIIAFLLAHGAKINQRTYLGHTPLTIAIWTGNTEICREFIEWGADVNVHLDNGQTPLEHAYPSSRDWKAKLMVALLRSKGAKLSAKELQHVKEYGF